jgi:hypothetical protein
MQLDELDEEGVLSLELATGSRWSTSSAEDGTVRGKTILE